jgi:hypothetical protein
VDDAWSRSRGSKTRLDAPTIPSSLENSDPEAQDHTMTDRNATAGKVPPITALAIVSVAAIGILAVLMLRQADVEGHRGIPQLATLPQEPEPEPATSGSPSPTASLPAPRVAEPTTLATPAVPPPAYVPLTDGPAPDAIDVTVIDLNDQAVAGAEVLVRSTMNRDQQETVQANLKRLREVSEKDPEERRKLLEEIANSTRELRGPSWDAPVARVLTDVDGRCRVPLLSGGDEVYASLDGTGTSGVWKPYHLEQTTPHEATAYRKVWEPAVTLRLLPQASVVGIAIDAESRPMPGAEVSVVRLIGVKREMHTEPRRVDPVVTDDSGRFRIHVDAPSMVTLVARAGPLQTAKRAVHVDPGEESAVELRVPGAFAVSGRVVRADGSPVAEAKVRVAGWDWEEVPEILSGADGSFTLALTEAGTYELMAVSKGLVTGSVVQVTLSAEEPHVSADIPLLPAGHLSGRVLWSTGEPVARATINVAADGKSLGPGHLSLTSEITPGARTDEAGRFRVEGLHPGLPCKVSCFVSITARAELRDVAPGSEDLELIIDRATADGVSVEVVAVDDATDAPLQAFTIWHDYWNNGLHEDSEKSDVRDAEGRFTLKHCSPTGEYGFILSAEGYSIVRLGPIVPGSDGSRLVARLGREGSLRVAVTGSNGRPAAGASVFVAQAYSDAFDRFDAYAQEAAGDDGALVLNGVPPGRYVVLACAADGSSDLTRTAVDSGRQTDVVVRIDPNVARGELMVTAQDADGQPLRGAEVEVTWLTTFSGTDGWTHTGISEVSPRTNDQGECLLEELLPGLYWIYVSPGDTFIAPVQAQVHSGERARLDFCDRD